MIHFSFSPTSNFTDIYQITQEGLLITKPNQLKPKQKHILEVSFRENLGPSLYLTELKLCQP